MISVTDLIPHRPPFLFVDEIVSENADGLTARRTWRSDEDFYKGHYPGAPITPGVLLCESVFQTAACYLALTGQFHPRKSSNPPPRPTDFPALGAVLKRMRPARHFPHTAVHVNGPLLTPKEVGPGQYGGVWGRG